VQQPVGENRTRGDQQADGLVAAECTALGVAAGFALLLDCIALELILHVRLIRRPPNRG
jgi:hypothetical protein